MSYLEIDGQRRAIPVGDVTIGSDPNGHIQLSGAGVAPRHAVIRVAADGQVVIRKAAEQLEVLVNGVRLGSQPTPLLHGDKVQIGPVDLLFVDERRSGSTQYVQAVNADAEPALGGRKGGAPTASTGGRIVSLTDGREYAVMGQSLVIGRDAGCDIVLTGKSASRRHAEIMVTPKGYVLVDSSTNGTFVNGARVHGQRLLARADVIKAGDDEFRFYADAARAAPPPAPAPAPAAQAADGAEQRLANTVFGMKAPPMAGTSAAPPPPSQAGPLATLIGRSGPLKGQRFAVRVPVVNLGRADYNDVVIPDESVSTVHAKLQRREGVWVVVDLESTNGTFVDGERVTGEAPIAPGALLRFGGVGLMFEPTDDAAETTMGSSTRMLQAVKHPDPPKPGPAAG